MSDWISTEEMVFAVTASKQDGHYSWAAASAAANAMLWRHVQSHDVEHSCDVGSAVVLEDLPRLEACLQADFFRPRPCLCLEPFLPRLTSVSHFLPHPWLGLTTSASALLCLAVSASSLWFLSRLASVS